MIEQIIGEHRLSALFQPIVSIGTGHVLGFEGLIRGPASTPLHSPLELFRQADAQGLRTQLERACLDQIVRAHRALGLQGKLFLNISCSGLFDLLAELQRNPGFLHDLQPTSTVLELTESQPTHDYHSLRESFEHLRQLGFEIAVDDLGEGYATLRLWSELRPNYIKIDRHFVQSIHRNAFKLRCVRSILQIADTTSARIIAEGIESPGELAMLKSLGVSFGQGYHLARPSATPVATLPNDVIRRLDRKPLSPFETDAAPASLVTTTARKLLIPVAPVTPRSSNEHIYRRFLRDPALHSVPVVANSTPVGLISRTRFIDIFSRLYTRDVYGKKPCTELMDREPLVVDVNLTIQQLSHLIVASDRRHLSDGFILTERGRYLGVGTGQDLMREITAMQIHAARYANPLTLLPGNVPTQQRIAQLIHRQCNFVACYCDLDYFKPFNDHYGYGRGDEVIQLAAQVLASVCDPELDFLGHIGGDDFVLVLRSGDWEERCRQALEQFGGQIQSFFDPEDIQRRGYETEDRQGAIVFHPLTSLSIGACPVEPGCARSPLEVSVWMTESKKQAKKFPGSLFIDRRKHARHEEAPLAVVPARVSREPRPS